MFETKVIKDSSVNLVHQTHVLTGEVS